LRDLAPEIFEQIESGIWNVRWMAEADFPSGVSYVWSSDQDLSWQGNTYRGAGEVLSVSGMDLTANLEATPFEVVLNGVDEIDRSLIFSGGYLFRPVTAYIAFVDEDEALVGEPIFGREAEIVGAQFQPNRNGGSQAMVFSISDETEDVANEQIMRQTDAAQRIIDPLDDHYAVTPGQIGELNW